MLKILKAGVLYFALVFAAGFALGTIRVLWVVPRLSTRTAELMEAPIMCVVSVISARWMVRRLQLPPEPGLRLGAGVIALAFLLVGELGVAFWLRGLTLREYIAGQDPVAGSVYLVTLGIFAAMPLLVARR